MGCEECWYCGKEFDPDAGRHGIGHDECAEEFRRREQAGICTQCGKNDAAEGNRECAACFGAKDYPNFQGYPGP